jgi:hypothetical protein
MQIEKGAIAKGIFQKVNFIARDCFKSGGDYTIGCASI